MADGILVVFEGVEGAGKTTQIARLSRRLDVLGVSHRAFREPGGTPLGDEIRALLLAPGRDVSPRAEALLFLASRAQLIEQEIRPALARGQVVILDRFFLSTYAYQVRGRGLPDATVAAANQLAIAGVVPSVTLILSIPVQEGMTRATQRGRKDRIEDAGAPFHARVEGAFGDFLDTEWQAAHAEAGPIVVVDASGTEAQVEARIGDVLAERFPRLRALGDRPA